MRSDSEYLSFSPRLKEVLESRRSVGANGEVIKVHSASTIGNIRVLRELILRESFSDTLEVGLAHGASALAILASLRDVNGESGYHHVAIDPFQFQDWGGAGVRLVEDEGFSDHFSLHGGASALVLPSLLQESESYDLIYIDGSHLFEDVLVDLYYSIRVLKDGGIILFDDCCDAHVRKVVKFIKNNLGGTLEEIDYRGLEDPRKEIKKKIGNFMGYRQISGFRKIGDANRKWNTAFKNF
jgi:predicted O-methyltransferase YrrM